MPRVEALPYMQADHHGVGFKTHIPLIFLPGFPFLQRPRSFGYRNVFVYYFRIMNNNVVSCVQNASLAGSSPYTWSVVYESLGGMRGKTRSIGQGNESSSVEMGRPRGWSGSTQGNQRRERGRKEGRKENRKCSPRCRHDKKQNDKKARIKNRQDLLLSSTFPPYTLLRPHKAEGLERQHGGDIQGGNPRTPLPGGRKRYI